MDNKVFILLISLALASCGGTTTFNEYARAGDTVAIPAGMQPDFSKDNITVTITPSSGPDIVITAPDPAIRGIVNLYPDPVSNMLVSRGIGENITPLAQTYAQTLRTSSPNNDSDYFQSTVFLNLPSTLPTGATQIVVSNGLGTSATVTLEIIPGVGTAHSFTTDFDTGIPVDADMFAGMARANHTTVTIQKTAGTPTPHAVEVTLTHDPDNTAGGTGKAFVINPLGALTNTSWNDDGTNMKIIMMVSEGGNTIIMKNYKFYVAGTATNLINGTVTGYDINGDEITGLSATLTQSN